MSPFLDNLLARQREPDAVIRPRNTSSYERALDVRAHDDSDDSTQELEVATQPTTPGERRHEQTQNATAVEAPAAPTSNDSVSPKIIQRDVTSRDPERVNKPPEPDKKTLAPLSHGSDTGSRREPDAADREVMRQTQAVPQAATRQYSASEGHNESPYSESSGPRAPMTVPLSKDDVTPSAPAKNEIASDNDEVVSPNRSKWSAAIPSQIVQDIADRLTPRISPIEPNAEEEKGVGPTDARPMDRDDSHATIGAPPRDRDELTALGQRDKGPWEQELHAIRSLFAVHEARGDEETARLATVHERGPNTSGTRHDLTERDDGEPVVQVTIGRIDVHSTGAPAVPEDSTPHRPSVMNLDDYLALRSGGDD